MGGCFEIRITNDQVHQTSLTKELKLMMFIDPSTFIHKFLGVRSVTLKFSDW